MNNTYSKRDAAWAYAMVLMTMPLAGAVVDMCAPSLPALSHHFHASHTQTQWMITFFLVVYAIAQLFVGPFSDAHGRKPLILTGSILNLLTIGAILLSHTITELLGWRLLQAIALAMMIVPTRAIIGDLFEGQEFNKRIKAMMIAWSVSPILSPVIGGYLQHLLGWESIFYFLAVYTGIVLLSVSLFLKESKQIKNPLVVSYLTATYKTLFSSRLFMCTVIFAALVYAPVLVFSIKTPFIVQIELHKSAIVFGHMALFVGGAWFLGNMLSRLSHRFALLSNHMLLLLISMLCMTLMVLYAGFFKDGVWLLTLPIMGCAIPGSLMFSSFSVEALAAFKSISGVASGAYFSLTWLVTALVGCLFSAIKLTDVKPLSISYLVLVVFTFLFFLLFFHGRDSRS